MEFVTAECGCAIPTGASCGCSSKRRRYDTAAKRRANPWIHAYASHGWRIATALVWQRANGQCEMIIDGERCQCREKLETHHQIPLVTLYASSRDWNSFIAAAHSTAGLLLVCRDHHIVADRWMVTTPKHVICGNCRGIKFGPTCLRCGYETRRLEIRRQAIARKLEERAERAVMRVCDERLRTWRADMIVALREQGRQWGYIADFVGLAGPGSAYNLARSVYPAASIFSR